MVLDKLSYTVGQAVDVTGASRTRIYLAIASSQLKTFKLGRRRLMTRDALASWITASQAASTGRRANG